MQSAVVLRCSVRWSGTVVTSAAAASSSQATVATARASSSFAARYAIRHSSRLPHAHTTPAARRHFCASSLVSQDNSTSRSSTSRTESRAASGIDIGSSGFFSDNQGPLLLSLLKYDDPKVCLHVLNDARTAADVIARADARHDVETNAAERNYEAPSRIDAYQHLHLHTPALLADITDDGLAALCIEAASEGLSEFVEQILNDLATSERGTAKTFSVMSRASDPTSADLFNAPAGSTRRFHALQYLVNASTQGLDRRTAEHHAQTWSKVRKLTLNISTHALKGVSTLLMKDLALIASRSLVSVSALLSRLHPAVARWLLMVVAKNGDAALVPLANALWQRVEAAASSVGGDFPTPPEAAALCEYYLSLRSQPAEAAAQILTPPSADASKISGSPVSLAIATRIVDALLTAHPSLATDGVLRACDDWDVRLAKHVNQFDMSRSERTETLMRLRVQSVMAFATSHAGLYSSSAYWLKTIQRDLQVMSDRFNDDVVKLFLLTPVRYALRKAFSTPEDAIKANMLLNTFLPLIIDTAVQHRHHSDMRWLREFCERLIEWGEIRRAVFIVFRTSDMVFERGRLRSDIGYMLGGDNITAIAAWLGKQRDHSTLVLLLKSVGVLEEGRSFAITSAAKNLLTPDHFAVLITVCAQAHLPSVAISLYNHVVVPQTDGQVMDRGGARERLKTLMTPQVRLTSAVERNRNISTDYSAPVTQSSKCMVKLIDVVTALPSRRKRQQHVDDKPSAEAPFFSKEFERQEVEGDAATPLTLGERFAYHVLFTFMQAKPFAMWQYDDLVDLAQALFRLGHKTDAFRCLADIPFRKAAYTSASFAVLTRGMAQTNLPKTLARLTEWCEMDYMQGRIDDSVLAPVVTEALINGQPYLALQALELAKARGLTEMTSVRSMAMIVFTLIAPSEKRDELLRIARLPPSADLDDGGEEGLAQDLYADHEEEAWKSGPARERAFVGEVSRTWRFIQRTIERDGWHADPRLLRWITQKLTEASDAHRNLAEHAVAAVYAKAAAGLLRTSGIHKEWVSHRAAIAVLTTIRSTAPARTSDEVQAQHREQLIDQLDSVVSVLRWVRFYYIEGRQTHGDEARTLLLGDSTADMVHALTLTRDSLAEKTAMLNVDYDVFDNRLSASASGGAPHPNKLPLMTYRVMIMAYLRLGDSLGAASVMCWARDEAHITMRDLESDFKSRDGRTWAETLHEAATSVAKRGALDHVGRTLSWLSGKEQVPKVKSWWQAPAWAHSSDQTTVLDTANTRAGVDEWDLMEEEEDDEEEGRDGEEEELL